MSEPEPLAVFHAANLPGHASNPDTDVVIDWPVSPGGVAFMPMSGTFLVRAADGSETECTHGFLVEGADGHPVWSATVPD